MKRAKRHIVSVSTCGVENNPTTQCSWITTVVCNDGAVFFIRNNDDKWYELPQIEKKKERKKKHEQT